MMSIRSNNENEVTSLKRPAESDFHFPGNHPLNHPYQITSMLSASTDNSSTDESSLSAFGGNHGRWTSDEHERFIEGINQFGREWDKVQAVVKTRSLAQIRSHAQKYFLKISKNEEMEKFQQSNVSSFLSQHHSTLTHNRSSSFSMLDHWYPTSVLYSMKNSSYQEEPSSSLSQQEDGDDSGRRSVSPSSFSQSVVDSPNSSMSAATVLDLMGNILKKLRVRRDEMVTISTSAAAAADLTMNCNTSGEGEGEREREVQSPIKMDDDHQSPKPYEYEMKQPSFSSVASPFNKEDGFKNNNNFDILQKAIEQLDGETYRNLAKNGNEELSSTTPSKSEKENDSPLTLMNVEEAAKKEGQDIQQEHGSYDI
jgi:SHAQKYF class myb-like DNA-binding protein